MEATLQALGTLPEENFLVLRFLTAFLVEVRPQAPLLLIWRQEGRGEGGGAAAPAVPWRGRGRQGPWLPAAAPRFPPQISAHSDHNKMTNTNLAVVFGPNLLWAKDAAITLKAINPINTFTKFLLDHQWELFPSSDSKGL